MKDVEVFMQCFFFNSLRMFEASKYTFLVKKDTVSLIWQDLIASVRANVFMCFESESLTFTRSHPSNASEVHTS